jgi:hypothetical protein
MKNSYMYPLKIRFHVEGSRTISLFKKETLDLYLNVMTFIAHAKTMS